MKVGYTSVVADLFHIGHLKYLKKGKALCDKLIVGVLTDEAAMIKKPRPTIPYKERVEIVKNIKCVDKVVQQNEYYPITNAKRLKVDILFSTTSHPKEMVEREGEAMKEIGGEIKVFPYYKSQSTTMIKKNIKSL